jgi:hypothetical protein
MQALKDLRLITTKVDDVEGKLFGFSDCAGVHWRDRAHFNVAQSLASDLGLYKCEDLFQFTWIGQRLAVIRKRQ